MTIRKRLGVVRRALIAKRQQKVFREFHKLYYENFGKQTWEINQFFGTRVLKNPFDLWTYQEIIYATKPDLIIETGTFNGGSTLYYARLFDLMGSGEIISIDLDPQPDLPAHPRITYIKASSIDSQVLEQVKDRAQRAERVMVILDSDHSRDHVLAEMRAYHGFVTPGCYMVVEDGNIHGHPVLIIHGPGPSEALEQFQKENNDFEVDLSCERHLMSFNPKGWLKKVDH